jgi:hypothetical protein
METDDAGRAGPASDELDVHAIDAYWLQRQISNYVRDAHAAQKMAEDGLSRIFCVSQIRISHAVIAPLFHLRSVCSSAGQRIHARDRKPPCRPHGLRQIPAHPASNEEPPQEHVVSSLRSPCLTLTSDVVVWCMKLKRAQSDTERQSVEAEMAGNPALRQLLDQLQGKSSVPEPQRRRAAAAPSAAAAAAAAPSGGYVVALSVSSHEESNRERERRRD